MFLCENGLLEIDETALARQLSDMKGIPISDARQRLQTKQPVTIYFDDGTQETGICIDVLSKVC